MNNSLLRLMELISIFDGQGVLEAELEAIAADDEPIETIDDLIDAMESEMSCWEA